MESITLSLIMLLAVVISGIFARLSPISIPLPLVQIAFGVLIAAVSSYKLEIEPHVFFLLFLPPLLFLDGWRIPKDSLTQDRRVILSLAVGLVVFTVLGAGLFIHWLIPAIPLPVAFALAAILSPTDPVAVSAIASRVTIPARLMHILEGEALLNDASGLVCMRLAVAAMLTGVFSLYTAVLTFLWLALGGLAVGIFTAWMVSTLKSKISHHYGEQTEIEILISLLVPFATYGIAETLQCSGILAAVAAGMTMSLLDYKGITLASTRLQRNAVWNTVQFALNGVIFVLLGEQLPTIISEAEAVVRAAGHKTTWWLYAAIVAIYLGLLLLRFIWVWVSLKIVSFRAKRHQRLPPKMSLRLLFATTLAGVRGTITLAGIMTLPLTMLDGAEFPGRDLAIFLATGIILISLICASIGLPFVLRKLHFTEQGAHLKEERDARIAASKAAITALENVIQNKNHAGTETMTTYVNIVSQLIAYYNNRIEELDLNQHSIENYNSHMKLEYELWKIALHAEREKIYEMRKQSKLTDIRMSKILHEIDLAELRLTAQ